MSKVQRLLPTYTAYMQAAHDAVPGMLVGLMLMVAYGIVLLSSMVGMLVRTNVEQVGTCGVPCMDASW